MKVHSIIWMQSILNPHNNLTTSRVGLAILFSVIVGLASRLGAHEGTLGHSHDQRVTDGLRGALDVHSRKPWALYSVSKENRFLNQLPENAQHIHDRCMDMWIGLSEGRITKTDGFLSEPGMVDGISKLFDFYCLEYVLFLEQEAGGGTSPFAISKNTSSAEYAALITEAGAILKAMGIHPSDSLTKIGRIGDVLVRLKDARAVPILSRGFFFTGPTVPLGDDSWYCSPEDIALDKFTLLLWSSKSKLSETFPKYDYLMRNRNYYDFVRKWLLENREQAMSAEFPKLANIQEAPFRAYLTAKAQSVSGIGADEEPVQKAASRDWFGVPGLGIAILALTLLAKSLSLFRKRGNGAETARKRRGNGAETARKRRGKGETGSGEES